MLNGKPISTKALDIAEDGGLRAYNQFMKHLTLSNPVNTVYIPFEDFLAKYFFLIVCSDEWDHILHICHIAVQGLIQQVK